MRSWHCLRFTAILVAMPAAGWAQGEPGDLLAERRSFARWLTASVWSPLRAVAHGPIGPRLTLGPEPADLVVEDAPAAVLTERGSRITLMVDGRPQAFGADRSATLGSYRLRTAGPAGRATITVYAPTAPFLRPEYFPYQASLRYQVVLRPAETPATVRILAPQGMEVEAREAGSVTVTIEGVTTTLRAVALPARAEAPAEIGIFFRDASGSRGSYPAGRFVALRPIEGGRYLLDFNRSRNPFCAYNTVIPCPAPWRGNTVAAEIRAGERYRDSVEPTRPAVRP